MIVNSEHITLSALTSLIGESIAVHMSPSYWIVAEVVEARENYSGHCYLSLAEKSDDKVIAQCRASIWKPTYRMLKPYFESSTGQAFTSGISIKIKVGVSFHNVYGLNLTVQDIDPAFTVGELTVRRQHILQLLEKDGVADLNKALEMPLVPQRIAVISSPTAAGYEDFVKQLKGNSYHYSFKLQLFPAIMQGDGAEDSVVGVMEQIFDRIDEFDALVIIRGGGSALDLACFDNYNIAFHLTQMPIPVLVGIGHERDETVLDLVAHTALKTPTAVAAYLIDLFQQVELQVDELMDRLHLAVRQTVIRENQRLYTLSASLPTLVSQTIADQKMNLQQKVYQLNQLSRHNLQQKEERLFPYLTRLRLGVNNVFSQCYHRLEQADLLAQMSDPRKLLEKGYSITMREGMVIKASDDVDVGDELVTYLHQGHIKNQVKEKL